MEEENKKKYRTTNKTVEIETIEEEKPVNYKRNLKIFITLGILSVLLFGYIIYLIITIFVR